MRFLIMICVLLFASAASAERVKICGPKGCYFVERSIIGAEQGKQTVSANVTVNSHQSSRAARRFRLFPLRGSAPRAVVRVRTEARRLLWWR